MSGHGKYFIIFIILSKLNRQDNIFSNNYIVFNYKIFYTVVNNLKKIHCEIVH